MDRRWRTDGAPWISTDYILFIYLFIHLFIYLFIYIYLKIIFLFIYLQYSNIFNADYFYLIITAIANMF